MLLRTISTAIMTTMFLDAQFPT